MTRNLLQNPNARLTRTLGKREGRRRSHRHDETVLAGALSEAPRRNDWRERLRFEHRRIADLKAMERPITKASTRRLAQAVKLANYNGWVPPPIINEAGAIIGEHLNYEAARELRWEEIPCIVVTGEVSPDEVRLITVALHQQASSAEIDLDALQFHLVELDAAGIALDITGIELPQIELLLQGAEQPDARLDQVPEPSSPVVSQPGDLWLLREHRLYCGDAADPAAYALLMEGKVAAASIGDPPYNVPIAGNVSGKGKVKHDDFVMGVGEWSDEQFEQFLTTYLKATAAHVRDGSAIFTFMDWRSAHLVVAAGEGAGLNHVNTCIWSKGGGAMGSPWRSAHEQILVFAKGDRIRTDNVELGRHGRNRTNVWEYAGANRPGSSAAKALALHSTPKSVEMIADAMRDVTATGDIVLDPFLGSGTTIMAAHAAGRIGYGLELDPKYVDVIVRRWQEFTGGSAIHAGTGKTFAEVAVSRAPAEGL